MALTKLYWKIDSGTLYLRNNSATGYSAWTITITSGETTAPWLTNARKDTFTKVSIVNALNITSMYRYFYSATKLKTFSGWSNITGVTNMTSCFYNCSSLITSPTIPSSVVYMNYTFNNCTSLTTPPNIPSTVISMNYTFYNCTSLVDASNVIVGPNVQYFNSCFRGCTNLEEPPNMDNATNIQNLHHAFHGCANMIWPPNFANMTEVTSMEGCFYGCTLLDTSFSVDSITIPNSVTNLAQCFYGCYLFNDSITIPNGVTNMNECFKGCQRFNQSITIPSSVTDINGCFYDCVQLNKKIFVENVPINHIDTFVGTSQNINIYVVASSEDSSEYTTWETIVDSYNNVQFGAINTDIEFDWGDYHYTYDNGYFGIKAIDNKSYYEEIQQPYINNTIYTITSMYETFKDKTNMTISPDIPNTVVNMNNTYLECSHFSGNTNSNTQLLIPSSITTMATTFGGCVNLEYLPDLSNAINLTIMDGTFWGCDSITTAPVIPNSVVDMDFCFYGCSSLETMSIIPPNVVDMEHCFEGCSSLVGNIIVQNNPSNYNYIFNGVENDIDIYLITATSDTAALATWTSIAENYEDYVSIGIPVRYWYFDLGDYRYTLGESGNSNYISVRVKDTRKTTYQTLINPYVNNVQYDLYMYYCFAGCSSLNQLIEIPSGVIKMNYCFYGCSSLNQLIEIPSSVTDMEGCFYDCSSLNQSIEIPNGVTKMNSCFAGCSSLNQSIEIPNSVTDMSACFAACVNFNKPIIIPSSVISMGSCFSMCTSFNSSITFVDTQLNPSQLDDMPYCFYQCSSFNQLITIPNNVTDIDYCFKGCTSFNQSIIIPSNVITMLECFYGCTSLSGIIEINCGQSGSTLEYDEDVFQNTIQKIILCGECDVDRLYNIAETANNYNVQVGELSITATAERITSQSPATSVKLTVTVTRFRGNNEPLGKTSPVTPGIQVSKDGIDLSGLTWYDPENPETVKSLIMVHPVESFVTTISGFDETTTSELSVKAIDRYRESLSVTTTISTNFYTMDFLAGGKEVSFGMKAVQDDLYRLLTTAPSDWVTSYVNYYKKVSGKYVLIDDANAPAFAQDTFYELLYPQGLFKCAMSFLQMNMVGEIKQYAGTTIPNGWLECDGSIVSQTQYPLLYAAIGDTWNVGTVASGMFMLPDFRGRVAVGYNSSDTSFNTVGKKDGSKNAVLVAHNHSVDAKDTGNNSVAHSHDTGATTWDKFVATSGVISNDEVGAISGSGYKIPRVDADYGFVSRDSIGNNSVAHKHTLGAHNTNTTGKTASGTSSTTQTGTDANLQPYAVVKYIICAA